MTKDSTSKPRFGKADPHAQRRNVALIIHRAAAMLPMEPREREFLHLLAATGVRGIYWNNTGAPLDVMLGVHWNWPTLRVRDARLTLTKMGLVHRWRGETNGAREGVGVVWEEITARLAEADLMLTLRRDIPLIYAPDDLDGMVALLVPEMDRKHPDWRTMTTAQRKRVVADISRHIAEQQTQRP